MNAAWKRLWGLDEDQTAGLAARFNLFDDEQAKEIGLAPLIERCWPASRWSCRRSSTTGELVPIDVVEETQRLIHSEIVAQRITLTKEAAGAVLRVSGNAIQLQQVLVNLVTNGIQAMRETPSAWGSIRHISTGSSSRWPTSAVTLVTTGGRQAGERRRVGTRPFRVGPAGVRSGRGHD